jgi:hypothetical protein
MDNAMNSFKRKNDTYYITLLLYVLFGLVYVVITGTISEDTFAFGIKDPVVYIIVLFILYAIVRLIMNLLRRPRIVFLDDRIVFQSQYGKREILHERIRTILLQRELNRPGQAGSGLVKIRSANRKRWYRIRVSNFERERDLFTMFQSLKNKVAA